MRVIERPEPLLAPTAEQVAATQLTRFIRHCAERSGESFPTYAAFERFAVRETGPFWSLFLDWSGIRTEGSAEPALLGSDCEQARFFPGLRLNYAENLLSSAVAEDSRPALTALDADGAVLRLTRGELREHVARTAAVLRRLGLGPGDRVAAIARNDAQTVVACLAVAALGATFCSAAPDMGAPALLSRFGQIEPRLLLCHTVSPVVPDLAGRAAEVAASLGSLAAVLTLDGGIVAAPVPVHDLPALAAVESAVEPDWPCFAFDHPLFILFSSGTTGRPKCIVHGAGGTLLEHVKEHRLHGDLDRSDRMLFQTSAAWMMWNWQLSALACGAEIVLHDGPAPTPEALWRLVAQQKVTVLGTSPAALKLCEDAGYAPGERHDLAALRVVLSTGSVLHDRQFDWVMRHVKRVPVQSISGGTDILGCFVLGNPNLPVWRGESQCRSLGLDVQALGADPAAGGPGELVCRNPFPSRPLGLFGDADGSRFHAAYFARNPGMWTHGDLVEITARGTVRMHGRSDGVLNVKGIRIGPAEIYAVLQDIPEIAEAMAIEQEIAAARAGSRMVLLVVLRNAAALTGELARRIRRELGRRASPAHVPAVIAAVPELPTTHSGKRSERAAADAINGRDAGNGEALRNPGVLQVLRDHPALHGPGPAAPAIAPDLPTAQWLLAAWEGLFGLSPVAPDDDFFELGGDSLAALSLVLLIRQRFGRDLPLSVVFRARTVAALAVLLDGETEAAFSPLVLLKPGEGRPVFLVHGMSGTLLELQDLVQLIGTARPVYGLQARALDPRCRPDRGVDEMADAYAALLREADPDGPYALVGYSFGGLVAYETARRLRDSGRPVELLALLDTQIHPRHLPLRQWLRFRRDRLLLDWRAMRGLSAVAAGGYAARLVIGKLEGMRLLLGLGHVRRVRTRTEEIFLPPELERVRSGCEIAYGRYRPRPLDVAVTLFRAAERDPRLCDPLLFWQHLTGALEVVEVPGDHLGMIAEPTVSMLADSLRRCLAGTEGPAAG